MTDTDQYFWHLAREPRYHQLRDRRVRLTIVDGSALVSTALGLWFLHAMNGEDSQSKFAESVMKW